MRNVPWFTQVLPPVTVSVLLPLPPTLVAPCVVSDPVPLKVPLLVTLNAPVMVALPEPPKVPPERATLPMVVFPFSAS